MKKRRIPLLSRAIDYIDGKDIVYCQEIAFFEAEIRTFVEVVNQEKRVHELGVYRFKNAEYDTSHKWTYAAVDCASGVTIAQRSSKKEMLEVLDDPALHKKLERIYASQKYDGFVRSFNTLLRRTERENKRRRT